MKYISSGLIAPIFIIFLIAFNYGQPVELDLLWEKEVDVETMKFTPDGNLLLTGGRNTDMNCYPYTCGQIKVWDVADSMLALSMGGFQMGLTNDIDISSDGQRLISAHGSVYCSAFSGCSRDRAGQFEFSINGSQLYTDTNPDGIIYSIAYSPNGSIIAAGTGYNNSGHITIYDSEYNVLRTLPGHSSRTTDLLFTNDGQYLISGGYDGYIRIWNYHNGAIVNYLQHGTYTNGGVDLKLSISPDGQYLASTGEGYNLTVKIWKISDGTLLHTLPVDAPHEGGGRSLVEFSPNGFYLANGLALFQSGGLGWHGRIRFYEVASGALVRDYIDSLGSPNAGGVRAFAFSPTGHNFFAYSVGYGNSNRLRLAMTDLELTPLTGIAGNETNTPGNFVLLQNYPNPFNPTTTITYYLPQTDEVEVILYDVIGRMVKELFTGIQPGGYHSIQIDGNDLNSGVYFYSVRYRNIIETRRCILAK